MPNISHFPKWLFILGLTFLPLQSANSIGLWDVIMPLNQTFLILFIWLAGFVVMGFSLYRMLLINQVRQQVHPHVFGATIILLCVGGFLLVSFLSLNENVGVAYFALLGCIYLFVLLMMVFLGKALRPLIFFLIIMAVIIAFRLVNVI